MLLPIYVTSALKPLNAATPSLFFITYLNLDFYLENMFGSFILGNERDGENDDAAVF